MGSQCFSVFYFKIIILISVIMKLFTFQFLGVAMLIVGTFAAPLSEERRGKNMMQNGKRDGANMMQNGDSGKRVNMMQNGESGKRVNMMQNGESGKRVNMMQNGQERADQKNMMQNG